jgi:hypothetical protein
MIIDCTMFHWEFDLLKLRMKELWDTVDYFVVTESVCDHRGKERELALSNNLSKFDWASEKLIVNISDKPKDTEISWDFEKYQRFQSFKAIKKFLKPQPDDLILISDIDEIFRAESIKRILSQDGIFIFHMPMYYYYFNLYVHEWYHAKAARYKYVEDPNKIRMGGDGFIFIPNSGWHFSYLGSAEQIQHKLKTFAHDEFDSSSFTDIEKIKIAIEEKKDLFNRFGDNKFKIQKLTGYWPKYILKNQKKYNNFIL